jgi:Domain of unknown function (DUF4251)
MKSLLIALTSLFLFTSVTQAQTKQADKESAIRDLVESKRFVFTVQSISPLRGGTRQATSTWDLNVKPDSIVSYLPYFGRAFSASMDPTQNGLNFTSTDFSYMMQKGKKNGWNITILPKDANDVQKMVLSIGSTGYGTLQVISNNRDPISFYGLVSEARQKGTKK